MHLGDSALRTIVARATTLDEHLQQPVTGHADALSRARWKRWSHLLGGDDALHVRLHSSGLNESQALALLSSDCEADTFPEWAIAFRELLSAYDHHADFQHNDGNEQRLLTPTFGVTAPFECFAATSLEPHYTLALRDHLRELLDELAGRVALLEAQRHAAQRNPLAIKDLSEAEVHEFVRDMLSGKLLSLFEEYSALARLLTIVTTQWVATTRQMLARTMHDAAHIERQCGVIPGAVRDINPGLSDAHHGGHQVASVTFASGLQLMYKPKAVASERAYAQLVHWLNANGAPFPFRAPHVFGDDQYGWSEFITAQDCADELGVQHYYERLGALQAVALVFGGTDLHVENVMAAGEWPVAVDTETFPYPHRRAWASASTDEPLEDSVLRTGVFPVWYPGVNGVSKAPLPGLDGVRARLVPHLDAVQHGFEGTYNFLASKRDVLLSPDGPLAAFNDVSARYVHRATAVYDFLLKRLAYPRYLRLGIDRSIEIEILARSCLPHEHGGESVPWSIFREEARALEKMDVPCFQVRSDSRSLSVRDTVIEADTFTHSGLESARHRIRNMGAADRALQRRCLEAAAHAACAPVVPPQSDLPEHADVNLAQAAAEIGRDIVGRALGDDTTRWLALHRVSNGELMRVHVLGDNLYDGRVGLALFLATLDTAYAPQVNRILDSCHGNTFREPRIGAATGVGGHIYALTRIAAMLRESRHLETAATLAKSLTPERIREDTTLDVTDGAAGALLGLLALHRVTGDEVLLDRADCCGQHLLDARVDTASGKRAWRTLGWPRPHTGMSHGAAGFAMALLRLAHATGNNAYRNAALEAIEYERAVFSPERNNWPDFRGVTGDTQQPTFQSTWCHGATGIGFARLATLDVMDTAHVRAEIDIALETSRQVTMRDADHLCCGNMGRVELLLEAGLRLERPDLVAEAQRAAAGIVVRARDARTFSLYAGVPGESFSLSFFHGVSGIGYTLLRLAFPGRFPCVLSWGVDAD